MRCSRVVGPSRSEVMDAPDPLPGPGELLVRVTACGVCVSDWGVWGQPPVTEPLRLGDEVSGVVDAVGPGTYGRSVGDRLPGWAGRATRISW
ncbi:MAG: alcohol dehydrogenase catalytic domain-containing protein [Acidimicrobiales bacterium]|jgi:NADPH:quinone reductase-like Zn-dependent oxidoreductase